MKWLFYLFCPLVFATYPIFDLPQDYNLYPRKENQLNYFVYSKNSKISINYSTQLTPLKLHEYVEKVKESYLKDSNFECKILGALSAKNITGTLIQINVEKTPFGSMQLWQWICLDNHVIYVLTASAPQDLFTEHAKIFQKVLESFTLVEDPLTLVSIKKQEALKTAIKNVVVQGKKYQQDFLEDQKFQSDVWIPFKHFLIENFDEKGFLFMHAILDHTKKQIETP
ncbi:MAG: hypothetical protein K940chlam8_00588 [Chlamydiae bacterium]|nr:hypothetical protein [Chlamydiota bacterium]